MQMSREQYQLHHHCNRTEALNRHRQIYKITPRNHFPNTILQESSFYKRVLVFQWEKSAQINYFPQSLELYLAHFLNIVTNFMNTSFFKNKYISVHTNHLLFFLLLSNKKHPIIWLSIKTDFHLSYMKCFFIFTSDKM